MASVARAQVLPSITVTPASLIATNASSNVTFTVTLAAGDTPVTYQWHWLDTNSIDWTLPNQTNLTLVIPIVSAFDTGGYYVIANNDAGATNSTTNALSIFTPANVSVVQTIISQNYGFDPLNTNKDLLLGLNDPNTPAAALTDGSSPVSGIPSGANFANLGVNSVQTFDLYAPCDISEIDTYSACTDASKANGNTMNQNYTLSVSSDNGATYTNVIYHVNAKASLLYNSSAPADVQVQLIPNNGGTVLASNADHIRFAFGNDLVTPNIFGDYMELMAYGTNKLTPGKPIITTDVPTSIQGTLLLPYSISVAALGNPIPSFQWYLISGGTTNAIPNATNSIYTVAQASLTNNLQQYRVIITNSFGSVTSAVAKVTVQGVVQVTNTIYYDTFNRVGNLYGSAPDTVNASNATWFDPNMFPTNQTNVVTDGFEAASTNNYHPGAIGGTNQYNNLFLPFTPQWNHIYKISCDLLGLTNTQQWLGFGFAQQPIGNNFFAAATCGADWVLYRGANNGWQSFQSGTGSKFSQGPGAFVTTNFFTFTLDLDTTTGNQSANTGWTCRIYTNGVQFTGGATAGVTGVYGPNPSITCVGIGEDNCPGMWRNFKLVDISYITVPAQLSVTNVAGQLTLTWPSAYTGWSLQSNSAGLQNSNAWVVVSGSAATNQVPITVDHTKNNVYFRLLSP